MIDESIEEPSIMDTASVGDGVTSVAARLSGDASDTPLAPKILTYEIAKLGGKDTKLERIDMTIAGDDYYVFCERLPLGRVREFAKLRLKGGKDSGEGVDLAVNFLRDHVCNEDGTAMFDDDSINDIPFDFALKLCEHIIEFFGGSRLGKAL